MVFTKLPRGRDLKENDPNGGGGAFPRSRKQLAKADLAPSIFGVVLLFVHRGIWRTGVHDIGIVFPGARGQNKSTHDHQKQDNAQYHHFASPPLQGGTTIPTLAMQCDPSETGVCNDQKPSKRNST